MNKPEALLFWLSHQGTKSPQYIHDSLCVQNPDLASEAVGEAELEFAHMVKFTCERIKEICLKKVGQDQAEQAVKNAYPWLNEKAFVRLWYHSQWVFDKCY
jgi:hypothetical protein